MLVSVCCSDHVTVQTTEDCSYYICVKCKMPADGRCSLSLSEGLQDADIQQKVVG